MASAAASAAIRARDGLLSLGPREVIQRFVSKAERPALTEPGEEIFELVDGCWVLEEHNGRLTIQAWNNTRVLARRVTGVQAETRERLTLQVERFGKKTGTMTIIDIARPSTEQYHRRSARLGLREAFRRFLRRSFGQYRMVELTTETVLSESLSPNFPRAFLRSGAEGLAAIAAPADALVADEVLSFGLIWLDYLRRREPRCAIRGLVLYLPAGYERTTCLRLHFLSGSAARYQAWAYGADGMEAPIDLADYGNLDTRVEPARTADRAVMEEIAAPLLAVDGVEAIARNDGAFSMRVRGLELARVGANGLTKTFDTHGPSPCSAAELAALAGGISEFRHPDAPDRHHPLYARSPELWLESRVRGALDKIDPSLLSEPIYGQVPAFASTAHGLIDLLAVDRTGRLAVIELKASEDIHLPLQALDYWMRVRWHLERGEFDAAGYFPGMRLRPEPPRLLLVAPAMQLHPSNEVVLRYFSPEVRVERIGVGLEWQKSLRVMLRA